MSESENAVLLVDDEAQFLQSASFSLRSSGYTHVTTCADSREALTFLEKGSFSVVLLDMLMPHLTGRELLPEIVSRYPGIAVVMSTAVNDIETAVDCIKAGAFDYLVKPVDKARLITTVRRASEHGALVRENQSLKKRLLCDSIENPSAFEEIVTRSSAMQGIFRYIEAIAATSLPVLITGETGSGKELVARAVHKASGRKGDFVAVNVAGLDDTLFTDTLFGHEKGAFTGADRPRSGLVAKAAGGTLFLDEIGELKPESQVKLLRLLEDRSYYSVGSDVPQRSDARVVVATNASIEPGNPATTFRKDLYYRLQSHHIRLPSLFQRKEDIPLLTDSFLNAASQELGKEPPTPPPELYVLLSTYSFPGNIRELKGMVFDAVSRHRGGVLSTESFREHIKVNRQSGASDVPVSQVESIPGGKIIFTEQLPTIKEIEQLLVDEAMRRAQSNQSIASQMLGITRSALNKRLNHPS